MSSASFAQDYGIAPPEYRLPNDVRLGRATLQVADLARSLDFYQHMLGLRALETEGDAAVLGVAGADSDDAILELRERRGAVPVPRRGRLGLYHFAILLPDRGALGRFMRHYGRAGGRLGMADHLVSEALYLSDPDGLGIEVYADRPRAQWRHRDREITMAADPLDVDGLLAAAGEAEWEGAPRGTALGHVHLSLSDLRVGEAFFHHALGFDKIAWSYPGALFFGAGGYHHHVGTNVWHAGAPEPGDGDARLMAWELMLPSERDVETLRMHLTRRGHEVVSSGGSFTVSGPGRIDLRARAAR